MTRARLEAVAADTAAAEKLLHRCRSGGSRGGGCSGPGPWHLDAFYTRPMLGRGMTLILACSLVLPAGAAAQDRPDPDSPAGVEYELPLDQTRKDLSDDGPGGGEAGSGGGGGERGSGGGGGNADDGGSGGSGPAPLFGAGISRKASSGGSQSGGGAGPKRGEGSKTREQQSADGGGDASTDSDGSEPAVVQAGTADGGSTGLLIPGLVLLVVLAGGAMGLLLRRGLNGAGDS